MKAQGDDLVAANSVYDCTVAVVSGRRLRASDVISDGLKIGEGRPLTDHKGV